MPKPDRINLRTATGLRWSRAAQALALALPALLLSACQPSADQGSPRKTRNTLFTQGGELRSPSGQKVVLRGINLQYGDEPGRRYPAIQRIADVGANALRLQLRSDTRPEELRRALDAIVARGMIAIPMYYAENITCSDDPDAFDAALRHWLGAWKPILQDPRYQRHLILNIANEWGRAKTPAQARDYLAAYARAVGQLRQAGYTVPLMVDAPDCGQNAQALAAAAQALLAADAEHNLLLSVHAYWSYQTPARIRAAVALLDATGLPFVWGEFGQSRFEAHSGHATDHHELMRDANAQGIGYLAWSWFGNGGEARVMDMAISANSAQLTEYGAEIVQGLSASARPYQP